ncbi:MAG: XRE family transcriptional regulator [Candidatus Omnitrophota bacterium]|jgi:transcriptional regulator with XRE-family HTH domain|nr:MAG: XRE family transcriptional regulator [Candidatus Omnitrophota bacterium]
MALKKPKQDQPDINRRIGIAVRDLRNLHGITQVQLAKEACIAQSMVSMIENGRRNACVNLNALQRIARVLKQNSLSEFIALAENVPTADAVILETEVMIKRNCYPI